MAHAAKVERSSTARIHELTLERDQARQALEGATGSLSKTEKESRRQVRSTLSLQYLLRDMTVEGYDW